MKKKLLCFAASYTILLSSFAYGFVFSSPAPGTAVDVGSTVAVSVDSQSAGPLVGILFTAYGAIGGRVLGSDFVVLPPYKWTLQLPRDYVGPVTFNAMGRVLGQKNGTPPEAETTINVKIPSNITLQQIHVREDQNKIFLKINEKEEVDVYGQFSDGIERHIESAASGTKYFSSDEKIAIVSVEGIVTAVAIGRAQITVTNADKKLTVNVIVKR